MPHTMLTDDGSRKKVYSDCKTSLTNHHLPNSSSMVESTMKL